MLGSGRDAALYAASAPETGALTRLVPFLKNAQEQGRLVTYEASEVSPDMSFLEMLDVLNESLISKGRSPSPSTTTAARASPLVRDLVVDRSALDRVMQAGGYVSVNTGAAVDGNAILVPRDKAEAAMDSAACIGCGACVAACPNASAMLFVSAKISQYALLPQGQLERSRRTLREFLRTAFWDEK